MEQEDGAGAEQELAGFNISETELIGLQQGPGLGLEGQDSTEHLSQGDLEALASIQDELDRMASGQGSVISEEIVMGGAGAGLGLGGGGEQVLVQGGAFEPGGLELAGLAAAEPSLVSPALQRHTVRVVKRPAGGLAGQGVKIRVGEGGAHQQIRVVTSGQALGLGGQQVRLVNSGGNNLKTIAPSEPSSSMGNISIVNQDGSFTTLPVAGPGIRIVSSADRQGRGRAQPIQPHPQLRIVPSQPQQSFKILNADGSLSDISSSFIRPKSDLHPIPSVVSSPRKKTVTYSSLALKSPQKVITLKPPEGPGQVIRTADGRLISLQGAAKKVVMPATAGNGALPLHHTFSPTKIIIRDAQGNNVQTVAAGQTRQGQVLRLEQPSDKVQYVRVVNSSGKSQAVPIRASGSSEPGGASVRGAMGASGPQAPTVAEVVRPEEPAASLAREKPRLVTALEPQGVRPRKPCNCTKSQCLKLYCDCFANGEFCHNCNCNGCLNNISNEEERQRSIKQCLDRNPNAFKPKIGKNTGEGERRHNKGCNCKRSGCLKNYCECYEAKIPCTASCKCLGCKNVDTGAAAKAGSEAAESKAAGGAPGQGLHLGERWFKPSTSLRSKLLQAPTPLDGDDKAGPGGARQPFSFVSQEVVEATCQCLLAQAEEGERKGQAEGEIERGVLEEFGRCLVQIIDFAGSGASGRPPRQRKS